MNQFKTATERQTYRQRERGGSSFPLSQHSSVAECLKVNTGNQRNNWHDIHLFLVLHYKP